MHKPDDVPVLGVKTSFEGDVDLDNFELSRCRRKTTPMRLYDEINVEMAISEYEGVCGEFNDEDGTDRGQITSDKKRREDAIVGRLFVVVQALLLAFFVMGTKYSSNDFRVEEYNVYRDIMAMLLLGFGYLMAFLKNYGLGAVGFTLMLTALAMEVNIAVELGVRFMYDLGGAANTSWPMSITMTTLIESEFAAATLMISFGALIGRVSPLQMLVLCLCQSVFYATNKILLYSVLGTEDVGGGMTIHMFGAYFGLAASYAMGGPKDLGSSQTCLPDKVADVLALIGTAVLWIFWPSFVGATETGNLVTEQRCIVNTVIALVASTTMTFYLSHTLNHGKFDPVHIANSTLAGGVGIGAVARLNIGPGWAMITGMLAGNASVYGYMFSSPYLQSKFGIFDTCGVNNLHGYPSIVGALLSVAFIGLDPSAEFLAHDMVPQMLRQLAGIGVTLGIGLLSGYGSGLLAAWSDGFVGDATKPTYTDAVWWRLVAY
jgi:ammonium transporter Rh